MNKAQKILLSAIILAIIAFSGTASLTRANTGLVNPGSLNVAGSSTVLPIANDEAGQFTSYWNNLNALNPSWGASNITGSINVIGQGSGTAIPALVTGTADIGEMSRPPQNSSAEWLAPNMTQMQIWAVGIDSVAIVLSPDMNWFPTNLTTLQVAQIFSNGTGAQAAPQFNTWNDFFTYNNISTAGVPAAALAEPINRAVRDPTSGTFDCFNNYFAVPNSFQFEHKTSGVVDASENMAPYSYCQENINIYNTVSAGTLGAHSDYIGFISLGYLETYGNMIGLNIAYNQYNLPASLIAYQAGHYTWGPYATPTRANVIYGVSGIKGTAATAQYSAWRWLWEVTPNAIPSTGPLLETGVWIAYMREGNTTQGGTNNFVNEQSYIPLSAGDISGGQVIDANLQPHTPLPGQTQSIPDGKVDFNDLTYFALGYIAYNSQHIYNPYLDLNADGNINFNDAKLFVTAYINYFITYNP